MGDEASVVLQEQIKIVTEEHSELTASKDTVTIAAETEQKDVFKDSLLAVTSIKGEFSAYKDKVSAYFDGKDEAVQNEYRPLAKQLLRVGDNEYTEPTDFPDLKEMASKEGTIHKKVMDAYAKYFDVADFTTISKAFEKGPSGDLFAGKVVKQSLSYMQFLTHRMRLGEIFIRLCRYRDDELEPEDDFRINKCLMLLQKDMEANPVRKDGSLEEIIHYFNIRMEYFMDCANDCIDIYLGRKDTKTEKRYKRDELREESRKDDTTIESSFGGYVKEMKEFVKGSKLARDVAGVFTGSTIEFSVDRLESMCHQSTREYNVAYMNVNYCLESLGEGLLPVKKQTSEFASRLDLMVAELKQKVRDDEKLTLEYCRDNIAALKEDEKNGDLEDYNDTLEDLVENYHEMFVNRSIVAQIELACAKLLEDAHTLLNGDERMANSLMEIINVMPLSLEDTKDTSLKSTLRGCLVLTELIQTKFVNLSFLQEPEITTQDILVDEKKLVDPNKNFDKIMEFYAPTIKGDEELKAEVEHKAGLDTPSGLSLARKECMLEIARGKETLNATIKNEFAGDTEKQFCSFVMDRIKSIEVGFERTNNYYLNVLETTCEPGTKEAEEIAGKALKTMFSELRDYSKFMNNMIRIVRSFSGIAKRVDGDPNRAEQFKDMLKTLTTMTETQSIYTSAEDSKKIFETPEILRGNMTMITGIMQLIQSKTEAIVSGKNVFDDVAKCEKIIFRIRELEEDASRTIISPEVMKALQIIKSQIAALESQGKEFGEDADYDAQLIALLEKEAKLSSAVEKVGKRHAEIVEEKEQLELSLYKMNRSFDVTTIDLDRTKKVETVAKAIADKAEFRRMFDRSDSSSLETTKNRRDRAMTDFNKQEAKRQIAEEKRLAEIAKAEEEQERWEARIEELQRRKEELFARAEAIRNSVKQKIQGLTSNLDEDVVDPATLEAEERLEVYIPSKATGRLKDYDLKGKKVKGVGKLESIGSCASSKLKERMGKHTRRFLYSKTITEEGLNTTANSIISGAAFINKTYLKSSSQAIADLKLVDNINACKNVTELKELMKNNCGQYIDGNGADEIALSDRFVDKNFASSKIILMQRIFKDMVITQASLSDLSAKDAQSLYERVDAAKYNINLLYKHCIGTSEYAEERARVLEDEANALSGEINEGRERGLNLSKYIRTLNEGEAAAITTMYATADALKALDEDALLRAKNLDTSAKSERAKKREYENLAKEVKKHVAKEAEKKLDKQKKNLILTGCCRDGKFVEGWILSDYAEAAEKYINKNFPTDDPNILELSIIGLNVSLKENLDAVRSYVSDVMLTGGEYEYLKNPVLFGMAEKEIVKFLGNNIFAAGSKTAVKDILSKKKPKRLLSEYHTTVAKMLEGIRKEKVLAPYAEAVLLDDDYIALVSSGDVNKVRKLIDAYKKNVEASESIISEAIAKLSYEKRLIIETNIKIRLGRQILKATPQSVENIIAREVDYQNLLHPVAEGSASAVVDKAKKLFLNPTKDMTEAIEKAIEEASELMTKEDEKDHDETDEDYLEYEMIHSVGVMLLFSDQEDVNRYCLEKLSYYVASTDKKTGLKSKVKQFLRDYTSEHNVNNTEITIERSEGKMNACEKLLARELLSGGKVRTSISGGRISEGLRDVLLGMSGRVMPLVKGLTPFLYDKKIISTATFDSLSASEVREVADYARERLVPLGNVLLENKSWKNYDEIKIALISRCLDTTKDFATSGELISIGTNEHARLNDEKTTMSQRKQLMSMGNCWASKKVSVDIVNRKLNTARDQEFRDLNRIGRARKMAYEMDKFCEKYHCISPMSIYEFGELEGNTELPEAELFEKWKADAIKGVNGWIGGEQNKTLKEAKKKFYDEVMHEKTAFRNLKLYAYYGMFEDFSVILRGVGDSLNDEEREGFEGKLFEVCRKYQSRQSYFYKVCRDYHLPMEEAKILLSNVSEHFVDEPSVLVAQGEETCEKEFRAYIDKTVAVASRYENTITVTEKRGAALEKYEKSKSVVARKDERIAGLACKKNGIFNPLIPVLIEDYDFQKAVLTMSDEDYQRYEASLAKKAEEPMKLLSEEGTIYNAFIDQFIIRFKAEIIGIKMEPSVSWKHTFEKYYEEICKHNYGTDKKPLTIDGIIREASEKAAKASSRRKDQDVDNANLIIQVILMDGALGVLDKKIMDGYKANLKTNTAILEKTLKEFYESAAFKEYLKLGKLQQSMGRDFDDKPETVLKNIFTKGVRLSEREFLVKENAEDYEENLERRLNAMLTASTVTVNVSDTVIRTRKQADELMQSSLVETKRQGRRTMREERDSYAVFENLADIKISPVMAALMEKKDKMSSKAVRQVEAFQKNVLEKLKGIGFTKELATEIGAARVAEGKQVTLEEMQICNANLEKLISKISIKSEIEKKVCFIRLATQIGNPFSEWTEDMITAAIGEMNSASAVSKMYKNIIELNAGLPEDGCLDSYFQSVRTAATYVAADGNDAEAEDKLRKIYTVAAKRILMMNQITEFINANAESFIKVKTKSLIARQKLALRAGMFDYFATEICNAEVKYDEKEIKLRISTLLANFMGNKQIRDYLISDTGSCTSISSDDSAAEKGDSEYGSAIAKAKFENRLAMFTDDKECGEYVKQYFALDAEQRLLFAHMANSQFLSNIPDASLSFMMIYGNKSENREMTAKIGQEYVNTQMITVSADYVRAERAIFYGKRPDIDKFKVVLAAVKEKHKEMLLKNVDLGLLSENGAKTRQILGKEPVKTVDSPQSFISELRNVSTGDSEENQAMINRLASLRPYELQMMAIILSDRTAVDIRMDDTVPVNAKRFELIKRSLRDDVVKALGDVPAGGDLLNKALVTLCSYRVKEDRIILGEITKDDLMDTERETVIDYALLRNAFAIMDGNHPEGLLRQAIRYSYDEVKSRAEIEKAASDDSRIRTYRLATMSIQTPEVLFRYIVRECPSEIGKDVSALNSEEKKLFMLLLANRGAVDVSRRFEDKVVDQDTRDRITGEFAEHGNVVVDEATFKNALAGIFSKRMDDAKIAKDYSMDVKDALETTERRTDIDMKLIEEALIAVKAIGKKK